MSRIRLRAFQLLVTSLVLTSLANTADVVTHFQRALQGFYSDEIAGNPHFLAGLGAWAVAPVVIRTAFDPLLSVITLAIVWWASDRRETRALALAGGLLVVANNPLSYTGFPVPRLLSDSIYHLKIALGGAAILRFAAVFPSPLTPEDLVRPPRGRRYLGPLLRWLPRRRRRSAAPGGPDRKPPRIGAWLLRPRVVWGLALCIALPHVLYAAFTGRPVDDVLGPLFWLVCVVQAVRYFRASYRRVGTEGRTRLLWVLVGFGCLCATVPVGAAGYGTAMLFSMDASLRLVVFAYTVPFVLFAMTPVCLAIAVFYHGALDPELTIRKTAIYGVLGVTFMATFVLMENLLETELAVWLHLSNASGGLLAGCAAALILGPVKNAVEAGTNRIVDHVLPPGTLAEGRREPVVLVFADLVGFSTAVEEDPQGAITSLVLFHRAAERATRANRGRRTAQIGDGLLLEFRDAEGAVRAALQMVEQYHQAAAARGLRRLEVKAGIHGGDAVRDREGGLYGSVVNTVSRLEVAAAPGEILISERVAASLPSAGPYRVEKAGVRQLSGSADGVLCFHCFRPQEERIPLPALHKR